MRAYLVAAASAALFFAPSAYAQEGAAAGMAGGAATGAIIGGPVGAAVGAGAGMVLGAAIDPPPQPVQTYVMQQPMSGSVVYEGDLAVGQPLPEQVVITPVPDHTTYAYSVVNDRRVIVDPNTRQVVQILD